MKTRAVQGMPLYTETWQRQFWAEKLWIGGIILLIAIVPLASIFYLGRVSYEEHGFLLFFLAIALIASISQFSHAKEVRFEFFAKGFTVSMGKEREEVAYQQIKRVWKGDYFTSPGGLKTLARLHPKMVKSWTPHPYARARVLGRYFGRWFWTPSREAIILEMQTGGQLLLLHTQDEERVLKLLKQGAPKADFSALS